MELPGIFKGSTLDKEQRLTAWSLYLLPGLALSGWITWLVPGDHLMAVQALFLLHALLGLLLLPIAALYLLFHFIRTLGNRSFPVFFSGIAAGLVLLIALGSGAWLFVFGQTETTRWLLDVHIYGTLLLLALGVGHAALYVSDWRTRRKRAGLWPSLKASRIRPAAWWLGSQIAVVFALVMLFGSSMKTGYKPVPEDYSQTYGEHPLRPSETEIKGGDLVTTSAIAGSSECGVCHGEITEQWRSSAHRKAALDPAYERNVNLLASNKGIEATRYCEGCHAPIALLTGELTPGGDHGGVDGTPANHEGISCKSCHSISRVIHTKGVGSYEYRPPRPYLFSDQNNPVAKALNRKLIEMKPELHRANFSVDKVNTPKFCATCHAQFMDKDMNDWGWVKMQDQYQSWLKSPYSGRSNSAFRAEKTTTCQDCHMRPEPAQDPSRSADGHVKGHAFAAANTFIPLTTNDPEHFEAVRDFLMADKMRVSIDVANNPRVTQSELHLDEKLRSQQTPPDYYYLGQTVKASILVSNVGVGHKFPAGTLDINQAWLSVQVTDGTGKIIHSSGEINEDGTVDPNAYFYKSIKVDRHGQEVWKHDLFNMVGEHYENSVEAGETDSVPLEFQVPWWATGPVTISVQLKYRKFNQRYASWVMKDDDFRLPDVVMANASVELPVRKRPKAEPDS